MRFRALVEIAKRSGIGRERARVALVQALALVNGVPGVVSRRFIWLDTEGLDTEIAHVVELARTAIDRGLVHSPGDPALARLLGQRRREHGERLAAGAGA
jgi:DNA-binding phage protein